MSTTLIRSTLDVAIWFIERAESAGGLLNPGRMHCLLYLAQARWASQTQGRKLMPATFIATGRGPLEPTIYHIFEGGHPGVDSIYPTGRAEVFLHEIWDRYGEKPVDDIRRSIEGNAAYTKALTQGRNSEIMIRAMTLAYGGTLPAAGKEPAKVIDGDQPDKPYYTQSGKRAVKWVPGMKRS